LIEDGEGEGEATDEVVGEAEADNEAVQKAEGEISPSMIKRGRSADLEEGSEEVVGKKVKIDGKLSLLLVDDELMSRCRIR
jgi:hypothetical protein